MGKQPTRKIESAARATVPLANSAASVDADLSGTHPPVSCLGGKDSSCTYVKRGRNSAWTGRKQDGDERSTRTRACASDRNSWSPAETIVPAWRQPFLFFLRWPGNNEPPGAPWRVSFSGFRLSGVMDGRLFNYSNVGPGPFWSSAAGISCRCPWDAGFPARVAR